MEKEEGFWTFDMVQERLVEAYGFLRRLPDPERRFLRVKTMSIWDQVSITAEMTAVERAEYLLYRAGDPPRMPGLTRVEIGRMDEALRWVEWIKPTVRTIMGRALEQLYHGNSRIAWGSMVADPTQPGSSEKLRKAYGRAIALICNTLNAASKAD